MFLSITTEQADEAISVHSRPLWRCVFRVLMLFFALAGVLWFFAEAVVQTTYFSKIRGHGYLACSVLCFLLSASLVYRARLENDGDRSRIVLAITSALLVFIAVIAEFQLLFLVGRLVFEVRRHHS